MLQRELRSETKSNQDTHLELLVGFRDNERHLLGSSAKESVIRNPESDESIQPKTPGRTRIFLRSSTRNLPGFV